MSKIEKDVGEVLFHPLLVVDSLFLAQIILIQKPLLSSFLTLVGLDLAFEQIFFVFPLLHRLKCFHLFTKYLLIFFRKTLDVRPCRRRYLLHLHHH